MKKTEQNNWGVTQYETSENEARMEQDYKLALTARVCITVAIVVLLIGLTIVAGIWISQR